MSHPSPPARDWRARCRGAFAILGLLAVGLVIAGLWASPAFADGGAGSLLAWGENAFGELGDGATTSSSVPVAVSGGVIPAGTRFTKIAAGGGHSLALSSTGRLYAWGYNLDGQLGDGGTANSSVPTLVSGGVMPTGTRFTEIAAGQDDSLALSSTGQLYAWGDNLYGQVGNGSTSGSPVLAPALVSGGAIPAGTTITQIAAGAIDTLALSSTGQLYAWGFDANGELGNGSTSSSPVPVPVSVPIGTTFTQIAAGGYHGLALSSTGQLYAWGDNEFGELGDGTQNASLVPVAVSPGTEFTQIAAGEAHSLALSSSGRLYAWGDNNDGQVGNGSTSGSPVLAPALVSGGAIPEGTTITQIAAGQDVSLALSSTGQLYAWGDDGDGELGNNSATSSPVPVAVSLPPTTTVDALARGSEAQHALVVIGDLSVTTSSLPTGAVGSAYGATVAGSGGATPYRWKAIGLPPGLSLEPVNGRLSGTPTVTGSYTVTVSLTDANGLTTGRSIPLTIAPAPGSGSGPPAQRCPAGHAGTTQTCHTPPTITRVTESRRTWREPGSHPRRAPVGTTFSLTLNEAATVILAFTSQVAGRKVKRGCVAPDRENRHKPACKATGVRGRLSLAAHVGTNKLRFLGRITQSNKLKPARYRVKITASNPARQRSKQRTLTFTIVN